MIVRGRQYTFTHWTLKIHVRHLATNGNLYRAWPFSWANKVLDIQRASNQRPPASSSNSLCRPTAICCFDKTQLPLRPFLRLWSLRRSGSVVVGACRWRLCPGVSLALWAVASQNSSDRGAIVDRDLDYYCWGRCEEQIDKKCGSPTH
ncbi:uncharacterized protein LOC111264619 [Varroa jacobsoni]|uniref:uncharacterized protein LOC111264619 n=1 Tax=Varroa jacobsoni TaxID=62625 RepID=UPI000BF9B0D2|nr:uncharacterized protein LOC111264619 [Varroa jacobsoni]